MKNFLQSLKSIKGLATILLPQLTIPLSFWQKKDYFISLIAQNCQFLKKLISDYSVVILILVMNILFLSGGLFMAFYLIKKYLNNNLMNWGWNLFLKTQKILKVLVPTHIKFP